MADREHFQALVRPVAHHCCTYTVDAYCYSGDGLAVVAVGSEIVGVVAVVAFVAVAGDS